MSPDSKIKVVHIITKLEYGGAQVNTVYTFENLHDPQFDAWLISGPGGVLGEKIERKDRFILIDHLVRQINPVKDLKAYRQLVILFKQLKPDIIHTHSSKAGILGRLAAYRARVPVIIHSVHGFSFSSYQSFFKRTFFYIAEKIVRIITDHFIFVAESDIETAKQKKLVKENYSLIRSGFQIKKFLEPVTDTPAVRDRFNIDKKSFVCGLISSLKPQKGLFHLVEIAELVLKQNKDVIFFIIGEGDLRHQLEAELEGRNIAGNFRLAGHIFDVWAVSAIFDIGVTTALWEGLPQGLIQFRLRKKAVVASNIPGNTEIIKDNKNGYVVDVQDYKTFAEKILFLIDNDEERQRLANYSDEDFSAWDADYMVREQEKVYLSLVTGDG
jgi:glycosyltransferase involved in cell wall biosynthesis